MAGTIKRLHRDVTTWSARRIVGEGTSLWLWTSNNF